LVDIKEVAENIRMFDNQLYSIPEWGSVYILNEEKKALVETGPTTSAGVVLDGIRSSGLRPEDIDYIVVTHIHLDHAGGAGALLRDMTNARLVVHHRGARHLVNPERLVKSVIQAQGEGAMARSGEVVPVAPERVLAVEDGDTIRLSDKQELSFIDAPGHAPHELCIYESRNRGLFTGDAVAVSLAGGEVFLPFHPPPNFDFEQNQDTIKKLTELKAEAIYYSHFGVSHRVQEDLQANLDKIQAWQDIVMEAIEEGAFEEAAERLTAHTRPELEPLKRNPLLYEYMINDHLPLIVAGHVGYYRQRYLAGQGS
jgi:glyoxylase-like metal-dependent hydrolase (beta-lactamase superfamily II)